MEYCEKHDIGILAVVEDLENKDSLTWKKPTWQKLLIANYLKAYHPEVTVVCYLDSDILINPKSPDIFDNFVSDKIGLVSMFKNLPYDRDETLHRISWLRHLSSNGEYPLDSSLYLNSRDLYDYHNLEPQPDYACMGLILFDVNKFAESFKEIFDMYQTSVHSITNNGDQTHLNYHFQSDFDIHWIDYKFQAIWVYEAANFYPNAFWPNDNGVKIENVIGSLANNYFLHFAGSWTESDIWKNCHKLLDNEVFEAITGFEQSRNFVRHGKVLGQLKPSFKQNSKLS
jgi:hypothetical protein